MLIARPLHQKLVDEPRPPGQSSLQPQFTDENRLSRKGRRIAQTVEMPPFAAVKGETRAGHGLLEQGKAAADGGGLSGVSGGGFF